MLKQVNANQASASKPPSGSRRSCSEARVRRPLAGSACLVQSVNKCNTKIIAAMLGGLEDEHKRRFIV